MTRAMVIDDERVITDTLAIILNNAGFDVRKAYSGIEALESLESFLPDVLLTDVIMPGMNGIEVSIIVRDRLPECKIILFSGQSATSDILADARTRGYEFEILAKPVHPTDLLARLRDTDKFMPKYKKVVA
jgi:CheY-like chemotaxis protein